MTYEELTKAYTDEVFLSISQGLYCLREFFRTANWDEKWSPPEQICDAINLTSECKEIAGAFRKANENISEANVLLALFLVFYRDKLLVDSNKCDTGALQGILNHAILQGNIRFPWLFDHLLYDRAYSQFATIPSALSRLEVQALLEGTPMGVFQLDDVIVGPFGLLQSFERRLLPPPNSLPLGHCEDQTCVAIHSSEIPPMSKTFLAALGKVVEFVRERISRPSDWGEFFYRRLNNYSYYDDFSLTGLPMFIGSVFSDEELAFLVERLLETQGTAIRDRLSKNTQFGSLFAGSSAKISSQLKKPQALQVVLIAKDVDIVAAMDDLVTSKRILIPSSEVRVGVDLPEIPNWSGTRCQCCDLGIRVVGDHDMEPAARLKRLILWLYREPPDTKQLYWILRTFKGATLGAKLENFISVEGPSFVIDKTVFSGPDKLRNALEHLHAAHLIPRSPEGERTLLDRIMWKLGFPRMSYSSILSGFYGKLEKLQKIAAEADTSPDQWREEVRSCGVNLFVALEEILDTSLSFATWVFLTDHVSRGHTYLPEEGRNLMTRNLSGVVSTSKGPVDFDAKGHNTLFPLIIGFSALRQVLERMLGEPREMYAKPEIELAHFSRDSALQIFPYRHRHFIFDMGFEERAYFLKLLDEIYLTLEASEVTSIRNRLEHRRDPFPTRDEIEKCCLALRETSTKLETVGLFPVLHATECINRELRGRVTVTSRNYSGRKLSWTVSPAIFAIPSFPSLDEPQILVWGMHIPETQETVRFKIRENSEYMKMWEGYPIHRKPEAKVGGEVSAPDVKN